MAKETFQKQDTYVWMVLGKWGKWRHPNKGHKRLAQKYWHSVGTRKWMFQTKENVLQLFSDAKIKRYAIRN